MKLLKYIYAPSGKIELEAMPLTHRKAHASKPKKAQKIEIYNIHGDMVCIVTNTKMIGMLNLQPGFYLIREIDGNGMIIKRSKLVY